MWHGHQISRFFCDLNCFVFRVIYRFSLCRSKLIYNLSAACQRCHKKRSKMFRIPGNCGIVRYRLRLDRGGTYCDHAVRYAWYDDFLFVSINVWNKLLLNALTFACCIIAVQCTRRTNINVHQTYTHGHCADKTCIIELPIKRGSPSL